MRLTLIALVAIATLVATFPSFACPPDYVPCGTRYCCPR